MFTVATATDPGRQRERNEDAVLAGSFDDGSWVLIVCDGMGGHDAGDVASKVAARRIYQEVNARLDESHVAQVLSDALHAAHEEVLDQAAERDSDMGTTAVVARMIGDRLWFAWVGDSRFYLVRGDELEANSLDHTVIQAAIDAGELEAHGDYGDHPDAHVLTQALGGEGIELLPSATDSITLHPGDLLVLCSDGLTDLMTPAETVQFVQGGEPEILAQALVDEANAREGHDNITVAVARFEGVENPSTEPEDQWLEPTVEYVSAPVRGKRVTVPDSPLQTKNRRTDPDDETSNHSKLVFFVLLALVGLVCVALALTVVVMVMLS